MDRPLMPKATAVWLVDNTTLTYFDKNHTREDFREAVRLTRQAGIDLATARVRSSQAMFEEAKSQLGRAEASLAAAEAEFDRTSDLVEHDTGAFQAPRARPNVAVAQVDVGAQCTQPLHVQVNRARPDRTASGQ